MILGHNSGAELSSDSPPQQISDQQPHRDREGEKERYMAWLAAPFRRHQSERNGAETTIK